MKKIPFLFLVIIIVSLFSSCTDFEFPSHSSDEDSILWLDSEITSSPKDTLDGTQDVTVITFNHNDESGLDHQTETELVTTAKPPIETTKTHPYTGIDPKNVTINDMFDLKHNRLSREKEVVGLVMTSEWIDIVLNRNPWAMPFMDVISVLGKPHGFRPGYPDTLVWITDTGHTFGIRFELKENEKYEPLNAFDQFIHSYAAWFHPVRCDMSLPDEYPFTELPIKEKKEPEVDPSIPWQELFFDLKREHHPSDDLLSNLYDIHGMPFNDIVSFLGKPHGYYFPGQMNNSTYLYWMSEKGNIYSIKTTVYYNKYNSLLTYKTAYVTSYYPRFYGGEIGYFPDGIGVFEDR